MKEQESKLLQEKERLLQVEQQLLQQDKLLQEKENDLEKRLDAATQARDKANEALKEANDFYGQMQVVLSEVQARQLKERKQRAMRINYEVDKWHAIASGQAPETHLLAE